MLPDVHEVILDNGFRALLIERHNLPVVATAMWCTVGARDEQTGESGLSHFLEHMMFKGTDRFGVGEIDLLTSRMGGSNNAFTDHDSTVYHFSLPATAWETALEIEASRLRGCALDPTEFTSEKSVVLEELAMGLDDPWRSLFQATEAMAFDRHPYHRPIIGWREELERVKVEQMRSYYERHYGANRAFLVVCGAIDRKRTQAKIEALFGGQPRAADRAPVIPEPERPGPRRGTIYAPGKTSRIACAFPACRVGDRDDFGLDLVANVLGHGKTSRLERRLTIDEPLAADVGVHNDVRFDPGLFWVYAELHSGVEPERAEAAMREEIDRFILDGPTENELARTRTQIRSSFLFEDEAVLGTALKVGRFEGTTERGYRMLDEVESIYDGMTVDDVRAIAARYLGSDTHATVWSLPEGQRRRSAESKSVVLEGSPS